MAQKTKATSQNNIKIVLALQMLAFLLELAVLTIALLTEEPYSLSLAIYIATGVMALLVGATICLLINFNRTAKEKSDLYDRVTLFVPGGFVDCKIDKTLSILKCNEKLIRHLGYSVTQFNEEFKGSFASLISPEDRERVVEELKKHSFDKDTQLNFRLLRKGNLAVPAIAICSFYRIPGSKRHTADITAARCLIIDSSSLKQIADERALDSERYKIIAEQSDSIIFDYNTKDKVLFINKNFEKKFGYTLPSTTNIFSLLVDNTLIHPDEYELVIGHFRALKPYTQFEARIKKADGSYIWCRFKISTLFDEREKPTRAIGKIVDIDEQNRHTAQLIEWTQRDMMTGLYNKTTTEFIISEDLRKIEKESDHCGKSTLCAMFVIDVDNFKQINDEFGHITGDNVLSRISAEITMTFRSSDVLGRVGGDEFVIFLKDLPSEEHATRKAQTVLSIIRDIRSIDGMKLSLSASIGISFYSKDGTTYKELFEKADKAMYVSKRLSKNAYTVYNRSV